MDAAWVPGFVTGSLAIVGVFVAGWLQSRRERRAAHHASYSPSPPTTQEVWQRVDRLERVVRSSVVILGEVADQWSSPHPPVLSKRHVAVLAKEGYMPPEWDPPVDENM